MNLDFKKENLQLTSDQIQNGRPRVKANVPRGLSEIQIPNGLDNSIILNGSGRSTKVDIIEIKNMTQWQNLAGWNFHHETVVANRKSRSSSNSRKIVYFDGNSQLHINQDGRFISWAGKTTKMYGESFLLQGWHKALFEVWISRVPTQVNKIHSKYQLGTI